MKVTIDATGYLRLSMTVLLAHSHEVLALDMVPAKVDMVNLRQSLIRDAELHDYLATKPLNLVATLSKEEA